MPRIARNKCLPNRAMEPGGKRWLYGHVRTVGMGQLILVGEDLQKCVCNDPVELCEFTYIKTKYGNPVYQHDVVKYRPGEHLAVAVYCSSLGQYVGVRLDRPGLLNLSEGTEVVGDIIRNPEIVEDSISWREYQRANG